MKIFYHNDPDGQAAGSIVNHFETLNGKRIIECIALTMGTPFPLNIIRPQEKIYIVDYRPDNWSELFRKTKNVTWIDHHKTSKDNFDEWSKNNKIPKNFDMLVNMKHAGCALAWMYFTDSSLPLWLKLVQDFDIFKWEFKDLTKWFINGLSLEDKKAEDLNSIWYYFLQSSADIIWDKVEEISNNGKIITQYKECRNNELIQYRYKRYFHGYKCIVLNTRRACGSEVFTDAGINLNEYDLYITATYTGSAWQISLYSNSVDVQELAKTYPGGGGHPGSAGITFSKEDFPFY